VPPRPRVVSGYLLQLERLFPSESLDALSRHIYVDDGQVERIVVQKFEPGGVFVFRQPTNIFTEALGGQRPILYVRVSNDPFEELS
jgi:crossover junction endodeoxyribonuclease RusA